MNSRHRGLLSFVVLIASLAVPQEAFVSQVHVQEVPHNWEHSLERAPVIVVARRSGSLQVQQAVAEVLGGRVLLFLEPHQDVWRYFDDSPEEGESLLDRRAAEHREP